LTLADLPATMEINTRIFTRKERWETKVDHLSRGSAIPSLAAEKDGKVVGFILGGASFLLEFFDKMGLPAEIW
jgi:hypothetical protein